MWQRLIQLARQLADKAVLAAALLTWWFVLRPDAEVINAVDTVSYLAMVYSLWRGGRSLADKYRSRRLRARRRDVVEPSESDQTPEAPSTTHTSR
jgi:hypothetical protein